MKKDDTTIRVEYKSAGRDGGEVWRYSSTFTVGEDAPDDILFGPEFATMEAASKAATEHAQELRKYHTHVRMVFESHAYERSVVPIA